MSVQVSELQDVKEDKPKLLKVSRPKKKIITPNESGDKKGDDRIAEVTGNFNVNIKHDDLILAQTLFKNKLTGSLEENAREMENIDWGGFDVEKIVDALYAISISVSEGEDYQYQRTISKRIFRAILMNESMPITMLVSRQSGKTELSARTGVTCCGVLPALAKIFPDKLPMFLKGFWLGVYAPSGEQAATLYNRMKIMAARESTQAIFKDPDIDTDLDKRSGAKWNNGSHFHAQSASPRSSIESKSYHLLLLDECQDMDADVMEKSLFPMLAWYNGLTVMAGTVNEKISYFYQQIVRNTELGTVLPDDKKLHHQYDYKEVIKHNPRYAKHVETEKIKNGEDSPKFKMSYALEWPHMKQSTFTPEDLKQYAMDPMRPLKSSATHGRFVAGIDLASKLNATVVTVLEIENTEMIFSDGEREAVHTVSICDWLELENTPYQQQKYSIFSFLENYQGLEAVVVDTTGAGDPVFEQFLEEWETDAHLYPFVFSSSAKDKLSKIFDEFFYSNRIRLPSDDRARKTARWQAFYLQFLSLTKVQQNNFTYYQKIQTNKKARDDFFDSLCLGLYGVKAVIEFGGEVEMLNSNYKELSLRKVSRGYSSMEDLRRNARAGRHIPLIEKNKYTRRKPRLLAED